MCEKGYCRKPFTYTDLLLRRQYRKATLEQKTLKRKGVRSWFTPQTIRSPLPLDGKPFARKRGGGASAFAPFPSERSPTRRGRWILRPPRTLRWLLTTGICLLKTTACAVPFTGITWPLPATGRSCLRKISIPGSSVNPRGNTVPSSEPTALRQPSVSELMRVKRSTAWVSTGISSMT